MTERDVNIGSSCSYATLGKYNAGSTLAGVPPSLAATKGMYIVPVFGANYGYQALSHGLPSGGSCSGFFNYTAAYGKGAANCSTTYKKKLCSGQSVGRIVN